MKVKKPVYAGVFFEPMAMQAIHRWWNQEVGTPQLGNRPDWPHVTTVFKPLWPEVIRMPMGRLLDVVIVGWAEDEMCQAVVVDGIHAARLPHITIGVASGGSAAHSNDLLAHGFQKTRGPRVVGRIGYMDGKEPVFELPPLELLKMGRFRR
jgi:hypothetical protein